MIAAIVQFRHVRRGNELAALLDIERSFAEPALQQALLYVQNELVTKLAQPAYRSELAARGYIDPRAHPEMIVCNWFNEIGTMVAGGYLNETVFFDSFGRLVDHYWRLVSPAVALQRRNRGTDHYERFEVLSGRAERWLREHPAGTYPPGVARLPLIDPWAAVDLAGDGGQVAAV